MAAGIIECPGFLSAHLYSLGSYNTGFGLNYMYFRVPSSLLWLGVTCLHGHLFWMMGYIWNIWDSSIILQGIKKNIDCHGISYYSRSLGHDILYGKFHAKYSRPASIRIQEITPNCKVYSYCICMSQDYQYIYNIHVVVLATPEGIA